MTGNVCEGVLLLHGIARRAASMRRIERHLAHAGYRTLNLDYPARRADLETLAAGIAPGVEAFAAGLARLHVVTHSMGGLVARALIVRHRPGNLGRVVMLGPPNAGSEVADRLRGLAPYRWMFGPAGQQLGTRRDVGTQACLGAIDYPLGVIAGERSLYPLASRLWLPRPNDGRVSVRATCVAGMHDHVTLPVDHATMMWRGPVIGHVLHFLREGRFGPDGQRLFARDTPLPPDAKLF